MKPYIFDLGFYNGDDTEYYLKKGYNVLAVEANPELINSAQIRFKKEIKEKKLILINKAIATKTGEEIPFFIHPTKAEGSSCNKQKVTWDGSTPREIKIKTITLHELYKYVKVAPYYIKTDIEENDTILVKQLFENINHIKPKYVSFEISRTHYHIIFCYLYVAGYNQFQLVNQANNEGKIDKKINYTFLKYSSGFFGEDLPKTKWMPFDDILSNYIKFKDLRIIDNQELALGWLDLHATCS